MTRSLLSFLIVFLVPLHILFSQPEDPVLFTVDGVPVQVSEFNYIYNKTNGEKADFSRRSVEEYLDLYIKFKLKVQRAKEMKLDTIPTLQNELEGYRQQLANSYLIDKEVTDKLVVEAYERMKRDVNVKHILFAVAPDATPADTLAAFQRANEALQRLKNGASFENLASEISDDKNSSQNEGSIGYVTAMLPSGFYELESIIYSLPEGEFGGPVRTKLGYHLVKVIDIRAARGELEASHILIRKKEDRPDEESKALADSIYQVLKKGGVFESLASSLSEDAASARKGGYIGTFGINRFEKSFEDAAFSLEKDADYTTPIETSIGWHIIRRVSKRDLQPLDKERRRLQALIQRDSRQKIAEAAMVSRIKRENNFEQNEKTIQSFMDSLDKQFLSYKWEVPSSAGDQVLFTLGEKDYDLGSFAQFCKRSTRVRLRSSTANPQVVAGMLLDEYTAEKCLDFEEDMLEEKHPEFKALLREYEEGILLFEATRLLVWDKASKDTTGLKEFFPMVANKYQWKERADVLEFSLAYSNKDEVNKIRKALAKKTLDKVLAKFNKNETEVLTVSEDRFERGKNERLDALNSWSIGDMTETWIDKTDGNVHFFRIKEVIPPTGKTLSEAKGYVIADYQDYLEKEWVKELRQDYEVDINKKVLDSIIK